MKDLAPYVQLILLVISAVGTIIAGLVKRSVTAQDRKIDGLTDKVDAIGEKVGRHAEQLAEGKAMIEELLRRAAALESQVVDVAVHGCARSGACSPRPSGGP